MDLRDHHTMPEPSSSAASAAASLVGRFLVAAPSMPDEKFQKSVVFVCKHDDDGALGIIVNNKVDDLPEGETLLIEGGMALTASLEILKDMAGGSGPKQAWLALGHAGWAPGQLDREMQDNAWLVVDADAALVFDTDFDAKWQRALNRLGGKGGPGGKFDLASFSHQAGRA